MIIGIDGNEANVQERVGVHQYAFELLWAFYRIRNSLSRELEFEIYLKNEKRTDLPDESPGWKYTILPGNRAWVFTCLTPRIFLDQKLSVFFSPSHYLPLSLTVPEVFTVHDLGYLNFSGQFKRRDFWQLKYWSAISIIVSKYIIAVSESTKKDIVRHYKFASQKTKTIYHGYDSVKFFPNISNNVVRRVLKSHKIPKNYILFLGTLKPSKNIENLLQAFANLDATYSEYKLVIAGKKGWLYESIFQKAKDLGVDDKVVFSGYVSEDEKPGLFAGAKVFVLPSYWEGFGMDVLNAMACGTPVAASNVASLPEIGGNAAYYFNPNNPKDIKNSIEKVLGASNLEYNKLVARGLDRVKSFSWEKTAKETLDLLTKAAK